jgi:hypothetical protein
MTKIETFVLQSGLNPRTDWEIDWDERLEDGSVAVAFEPYHELWPAYCECHTVEEGYAILHMPPGDESNVTNCREPSQWLPNNYWHWCIVPEIYLRLQ